MKNKGGFYPIERQAAVPLHCSCILYLSHNMDSVWGFLSLGHLGIIQHINLAQSEPHNNTADRAGEETAASCWDQ